MNQIAALRWQIARRQLDGIPRTLANRARRDYWAELFVQVQVDDAVGRVVVGARRSWLGKDAA